jgi:hypothetical protein
VKYIKTFEKINHIFNFKDYKQEINQILNIAKDNGIYVHDRLSKQEEIRSGTFAGVRRFMDKYKEEKYSHIIEFEDRESPNFLSTIGEVIRRIESLDTAFKYTFTATKLVAVSGRGYKTGHRPPIFITGFPFITTYREKHDFDNLEDIPNNFKIVKAICKNL